MGKIKQNINYYEIVIETRSISEAIKLLKTKGYKIVSYSPIEVDVITVMGYDAPENHFNDITKITDVVYHW